MPKRVLLIGHPVAHSLSEKLQQACFDALGVDATYEAADRPLIELAETIEGLRSEDSLGATITVPYKERVTSMVDRLTEEAHATGAVDTITREGKRLIGHNTDVVGFRHALDALVGRQKMPREAVVLGAGGGARAAVYTFITSGFQHVVVFNRHLHRAENLVKHFARSAAHMELRARPWHESVIESELAKTKVLVNASSLGRDPAETPIPGEILPPELLVLDLQYMPKETRLMREAKAAGATAVMNGDIMLIHQSAAAFELWTGQQAPLDLLRETLERTRDLPDEPVAGEAAEAPAQGS
jgi:shikimate dehydrogenase